MAWSEVEAGVLERPIGENEIFIKLTGDSGLPVGREHWAITLQATLLVQGNAVTTSDVLPDALREAWKRFRFVQPNIATRATGDEIIYEIPTPVTIENWTAETFLIAAPGVSSRDLIAARTPSQYAILHYIPDESRILLQTSHWRTDGIGILHLLDAYLDLVCHVAVDTVLSFTWGAEVSRLSESVEDICEQPLVASSDIQSVAEAVLSTFALIPNNIGIKYRGDSTTPPQGTRLQRVQFNKAESAAIFEAAKTRNISVTSVVHASVAQANQAFTPESSRDKAYTSTIRFGLRPYVPKAYSGPQYGATLMTSGYIFRATPMAASPEQWLINARAFNTEYRKGYGDLMPAHQEYARGLCEVVRNLAPPDPADLPCDMDIPSLGIIDRLLKPLHRAGDQEGKAVIDLEVTDVAVSTEILTRQSVCFVWTFRDVLDLQITYNEAYHDGEEVKQIVKYIQAVTLEQLGVDGA